MKRKRPRPKQKRTYEQQIIHDYQQLSPERQKRVYRRFRMWLKTIGVIALLIIWWWQIGLIIN